MPQFSPEFKSIKSGTVNLWWSLDSTLIIISLITFDISFTLEDLNYQYPNEVTPQKKGAGEHLAQLSKQGLINRFKKLKKPIPKKVISMMKEDKLIEEYKEN